MLNCLKKLTILNGRELVISKAVVADAIEIVTFLNQVGGETDFLTFGLNEFPYSVDEQKRIILEFLEPKEGLMLVGKISDKIVSHLFLQRFSKARIKHIGEIAITVNKKNWGQGIGTHMIESAVKWAKSNGITKLQLQVRSDNKQAIRLYNKLNFIIEGEISQAIKINNCYFSDYLMGIML